MDAFNPHKNALKVGMDPIALQNMNPLFLVAEFPWTMELATS
jgi:hypothetical protein